jgi:hypothetical protein
MARFFIRLLCRLDIVVLLVVSAGYADAAPALHLPQHRLDIARKGC